MTDTCQGLPHCANYRSLTEANCRISGVNLPEGRLSVPGTSTDHETVHYSVLSDDDGPNEDRPVLLTSVPGATGCSACRDSDRTSTSRISGFGYGKGLPGLPQKQCFHCRLRLWTFYGLSCFCRSGPVGLCHRLTNAAVRSIRVCRPHDKRYRIRKTGTAKHQAGRSATAATDSAVMCR